MDWAVDKTRFGRTVLASTMRSPNEAWVSLYSYMGNLLRKGGATCARRAASPLAVVEHTKTRDSVTVVT